MLTHQNYLRIWDHWQWWHQAQNWPHQNLLFYLEWFKRIILSWVWQFVFIRKHFAGSLSSLQKENFSLNVKIAFKQFVDRSSFDNSHEPVIIITRHIIFHYSDGSNIVPPPQYNVIPNLTPDPSIIPKQEYGPRPAATSWAAWELSFHFYLLSVNRKAECREAPSTNK